MTIPKSTIDDPTIFPMAGRSSDSMLNLVSPKNKLLFAYEASIDPTPTDSLPPKVTFEGAGGSSNASKVAKKKKQAAKPKEVEEEVIKQTVPTKSGKGCSIRRRKLFLENNLRNSHSHKLRNHNRRKWRNKLRKLMRRFLLLLMTTQLKKPKFLFQHLFLRSLRRCN